MSTTRLLKPFSITALVLFFTSSVMASAAPVAGGPKKLPAKQLMVVITDNWNALQGTIYVFNKEHGKWVLQFSNAVVVGSKGLGLGMGAEPVAIDGAPVKKEGDLKAPAGIFSIGTAFGYADYQDAKWLNNRYVKATDTLICVDDMRSASYNTLLNKDTAKGDYKSWEDIHRKDDFYKWGLFINHNADKPVAGGGSCIFMHIWDNDHVGTEGCTAMQEADMVRILHWIDSKKHPLLVQVPKAEYAKLSAQFELPEID